MRRLQSKLVLCFLLGHLRISVSFARGAHMVTLLHQTNDQWEDEPKMGTEDAFKECSDERDIVMDSIMDMKHSLDMPAKGKLILIDKEDYSKMFTHEDDSLLNEYKMLTTDIQMGQAEGDCPVSNMAYDMMDHGLYFGKLQQSRPEIPMGKIDITPADIMIPPRNPYSKIALAQKRQHLASKFPIKSSKLTPVDKQPIQTTAAPETEVQFEQRNTWEAEREPVAINSVIPNQNTFKDSDQPEQQLLQTIRTSSRQTPNRSLPMRTNSSLTNLGSGVFGNRFDLASPRGAEVNLSGQRARNSLLRASEVARSLKMREQDGLTNHMQAP